MSRIVYWMMLLVMVGSVINATAGEVETGTVTGILKIKQGGPMAGGTVFFFKESTGPAPSIDRYWRIPDETATIDSEGKFTANLVAGTYYFGAIKRASGSEFGPPREGDYFLSVTDGKGKPRKFVVKSGGTVNVGTIADAVPHKQSNVKDQQGITAIEGAVTDLDGKPVEGIIVFAFTMPGMVGKPLFVSDRTGNDGKYVLRLQSGGTYYLRAREVYGGGAPKTGEFMGGLGKGEAAKVVVKTGETIAGIDLKGSRFEGRGPKKE